MALIKEPYGLVYNTDGTLCTTYRDDDVPFRGVRSLAVEAWTTNLVPSNIASFTSLSGLNSSSIISREIIEGGGYGGRNAIKIVKDSVRTNYQIYSDILKNNILNNIQVGDRISYQIKYKVLDAGEGGYICNFWTWGFGGSYSKTIVDIGNGWFLQYGTSTQQWTESSAITGSCGIAELPANSTILFSDFQVEIKNYSTSFVDGSRRGGIADFPGFNENSWVVNFWYKNTYPVNSLVEEGFGMRFVQDTGYLHFRNGLNNTTFFLSQDSFSNQFTPFRENLSDGQWRNFVVIYDPNELKFYVNGVYRATVTSIDFTRKLIGVQLWGRTNSLFSNIFIGKYRRDDDSVIWTDEYIREVYEAKIPFPVQSQLSIY